MTDQPLDPGTRCWFTVYRCYVTVAERYESGNYLVTWDEFRCTARPEELLPAPEQQPKPVQAEMELEPNA